MFSSDLYLSNKKQAGSVEKYFLDGVDYLRHTFLYYLV